MFSRFNRIWIGVSVVGSLLLLCSLYGLFFMHKLTKTVEVMHVPIERTVSDKRNEPITFKEQTPFSILILGVDEREHDKGRSDTMIVLTVNPTDHTTKMLSIPRDTRSKIIGMDIEDKLNHAYAFGGIEMSLASIEYLLDIPIDYVVQVNMESFKDIIDAVDGVSVHNTMAFNAEDFAFPKGEITLTGEEALAYVRMRKEDPRGDFGRQDRQKQVIRGVLEKGASLNSLVNFRNIFDAIGKNVRTNMTFDEMVDIQKNYRKAVQSIDQIMVESGRGEWKDGIWYYIMDADELLAIQNELQEHLQID